METNTPPDWKNPEWEKGGMAHNWKSYFNAEVREIWDTFSDNQKQTLARSAEEAANQEAWD